MPKNSKSRPKRGKGPGSAAGSLAAIPLSAHRAKRGVAELTPEFVDWFADHVGTRDDAKICLEVVTALVAGYLEDTGTVNVTSFSPEPLAELVDAIDSGDPDNAEMIVEALHVYVDFLEETGKWSGTEGSYWACHELLAGDAEDEGDIEIDIPDIPDDVEVDFLKTLPLMRQAAALLEWIGNGKQVTGTGAVRLKDVEAAAFCVGVRARGRGRKQPSGTPELPGIDGAPTDDMQDVMVVRSMYEVPVLGDMWRTLEKAGMIKTSANRVVATELGTPRLHPNGAAAAATYRRFIGEFLASSLFTAEASELWAEIPVMQAIALAAACGEDPPAIGELLAKAEERMSSDVELPVLDPYGEIDEEAEKTMALVLSRIAFAGFPELADLGLVQLDSHLRVPPQLIRSVGEMLHAEFDFDLDYPTGMLRAEQEAPAPVAIYQLKIQLKGSKPPIWRRLEVRSDLRLDHLHGVIQASFEWMDGHLHEFMVGGWRGQSYGPVSDDMGYDDSIDEATVHLSDVLGAEGQKLDYVYDFGDNWEHAITLEKILAAPADAIGALPRCTGGRSTAPLEDSGGVWGWVEKVQAANDPAHPEHEEVREWFGLSDGEQLDLKAFDRDEVNENLQDLLDHWEAAARRGRR